MTNVRRVLNAIVEIVWDQIVIIMMIFGKIEIIAGEYGGLGKRFGIVLINNEDVKDCQLVQIVWIQENAKLIMHVSQMHVNL